MSGFERKILLQQLMWIGGGLALSVAINFGMFALLGDAAFPWNIIVLVFVFLAIGYTVQKRAMKRMGMIGDSGSGFSLFGGLKKATGSKYQCYKCSQLYRGNFCPKCGAKGGKIQF